VRIKGGPKRQFYIFYIFFSNFNLFLKLSSSRPYVRKKALLLLFKMFLKYPDTLRTMFPKLKERLEDQDPGNEIFLISEKKTF